MSTIIILSIYLSMYLLIYLCAQYIQVSLRVKECHVSSESAYCKFLKREVRQGTR